MNSCPASVRVFGVVAVLALGLAACSSSAASASNSDNAAFPATISTKFGGVTIDEAPRRVVALGWGDAELALSLGVQPDLLLILDVRSSGDRERYDTLSAIAPVVGIPEGADNWLTDRSTQLEWWGRQQKACHQCCRR
ncbi:ABC transporter substrate-binding protein [Corynebacterium aurimucosum]|uniref:ABC-type transport system, periplasmic component n=1 Tax=Corynebacterium aurimucosum (strain ATCC 700975 / DSM 44827 / CIP 107346 / CN-1) TaxID=548476 RepID=C3PER9_CORA7|nr:ABC-type transport system, periplasmic component [Corynebacterium aurimucosum ATCC 700975]QQU93489.1 ABC transporter substrate-binding protein [Corynebacterium aurimucosum]